MLLCSVGRLSGMHRVGGMWGEQYRINGKGKANVTVLLYSMYGNVCAGCRGYCDK